METSKRTDNLESDEDNQRFYKTQSLDQKDSSPIIAIEAEMKDGEDFPCLKNHSSVFMKNNIVLFGGRDSYGKMNNAFHIYNLEARMWQKKVLQGKSIEIPNLRTYHTANVVGNFIFIIGGNTGKYSRDSNVYKINFDTQKCQIIGKIIDPVQGHTADVHKKCLYIFGGKSMQTRKFTSMLQKFNLLTNQCEVIKPIGYKPKGRFGHKSIILQDDLFVFGGYYSYFLFDQTDYWQDLFSIDLTNNISTEIEQHGLIPSARKCFSFFAFEDKLYLFGGNSENDYFSDFYAFDLKSSTWKAQEVKNQKCLLNRGYHSTVAVKESSCKLKVYLVGGKESQILQSKNMNVITISNDRIFWILHYLEGTGIRHLPGLNLIQEIIEMIE